MKRIIIPTIAVIAALVAGTVIGTQQSQERAVVHPAEISKADAGGAIFDRPETIRTVRGDVTVLDTATLTSSDSKFASGMYRAGKSRSEVNEPWGVDEFMYFLEGGVTLTSADGSVQVIEAGEAVTIPKEWTGVWETDGYTKIWAIYSADGSGI